MGRRRKRKNFLNPEGCCIPSSESERPMRRVARFGGSGLFSREHRWRCLSSHDPERNMYAGFRNAQKTRFSKASHQTLEESCARFTRQCVARALRHSSKHESHSRRQNRPRPIFLSLIPIPSPLRVCPLQFCSVGRIGPSPPDLDLLPKVTKRGRAKWPLVRRTSAPTARPHSSLGHRPRYRNCRSNALRLAKAASIPPEFRVCSDPS